MITPFSLSVVLPVFNEDQTIQLTLQQSIDYLKQQSYLEKFEVIVVDDGSADNSAEVIRRFQSKHANVKTVTHSNNRGYGAAMISGIHEAQYGWILLMDADGQIHIDALERAVSYVNDYDIVGGYREKRMDSLYRTLLGKTYTLCARILLGVKSRDINCGFKLFKRQMLDVDGIKTHAGAFYTHVYLNAQRMDARLKEVPIEHFPRRQGSSTGANYKVVTTAMTDMIKLIMEKIKRS